MPKRRQWGISQVNRPQLKLLELLTSRRHYHPVAIRDWNPDCEQYCCRRASNRRIAAIGSGFVIILFFPTVLFVNRWCHFTKTTIGTMRRILDGRHISNVSSPRNNDGQSLMLLIIEEIHGIIQQFNFGTHTSYSRPVYTDKTT